MGAQSFGAKFLPKLSGQVMTQISYFGQKILHLKKIFRQAKIFRVDG